MPFKPLKPCSHPMCPALVDYGKCEAHRLKSQREYDQTDRPEKKFYKTKFWKALRDMVHIEEPFCRTCQAPTKIIDHIVPRSIGGTDERSNLQGLCHACHNAKTSKERNKND